MSGGSVKLRVTVSHAVHREVVELLSQSCTVIANDRRTTWSHQELLEKAQHADALMVFMPDLIDEEFLRHCPNLKIVAAALKGFDNFDVEAMSRRGIWFTIVPDLLTAPTAELAVTLLLGLTRRVLDGDRFVRSGNFTGWRPELYGAGLSGRIVGIVGMGAVGRTIAERLVGFDVKIVYHDRHRLEPNEEVARGWVGLTLEQLLKQSDCVILAAPLLDSTLHLINDATLAVMKPNSYLVNVGRGSVVDETAVARALESGKLAGYAADVFEMEDLQRQDCPKSIPQTLLDNRNQTLFTPHLGSAVDEVRRQIELRAAHNILQALRGEIPADAVNKPKSAGSLRSIAQVSP
jgi:phosphonate dehydrogenase